MHKLTKEEALAFQRAFNDKTPTSKKFAQEHRQRLADSRASAGIRPSTKEMVYRIFADKADGAHIYDIDGNRYVDISMGFGVLLCGHFPDYMRKALEEQIQRGINLGPETPLIGETIDLIHEFTGAERIAFYNTGTEAVMMALRFARGRKSGKKIVAFSNSYHGHYDDIAPMNNMYMYTPDRSASLQYGSDSALDAIKADAEHIAAVIVEPVQSANLDLKPKEFLQQLRQLTKDYGIALIFDEMVSGFRVDQGGAQAWFGVQADIVVYGKIIGGGLPAGVVAGSAYYLDQVDGGHWQFGDNSLPTEERVMSAGTFNKNPLSIATTLGLLRHLKQEGPNLQKNLNAKSQACFKQMNEFLNQHGYPIKVASFGSQFRFMSNRNIDPFIYRLIHKGLYIWENRNLYFSTAHSNEDYAFVQQCVEDCAHEVYRGPEPVSKKTSTGRIEEAL
jgi:glutamate-1-semialdehyde aminotransferase